MNLKLRYKSVLVLTAMVLLTACDAWRDDTQLKNGDLDKTLYEVIRANSDISIFAHILQLTGYETFLREEQALTVFAPADNALKDMDLTNVEALTVWVKNYIAYLTYYTDQSGTFEVNAIEMLNGKSVPVNASGISGATIIKANWTSANGVLHIIDNVIIDRKNIWEYLQEQPGYEQIDFIRSLEEEVMDRDKSVQTGVDVNGQPLYDTVWVKRNTFLETYPLDNEYQSFTVVLLEKAALDVLKAKYAKYFIQKDPIAQDKEIIRQITSDLTLKKQVITTSGRFPSQDDILVDINPTDIKESYQASNGMVYKLSAADIKMYENKIKTQIIEAEDYASRYDGASTDPEKDAWVVRYRSWASGGKDVVLKGATRNTVEYDEYDPEEDVIKRLSKTYTYTITYRTNDPIVSKASNAYLKYEPVMYSVDYEIYWVAYDDITSHYTNFGDDTIKRPMVLEQKLLISFPGELPLVRDNDAKITHNFSPNFVMAGVSTAGIHEETQLVRYRVNTTTTATQGLFVLDQPFTAEDSFGGSTTLKSSTYGKATFMVANTVRETNTNAGLIFLDYIRLVPLVDPND
jgi:hypothetical protein